MNRLKVGLVGLGEKGAWSKTKPRKGKGRGGGYGSLFVDHPRTEIMALCDIDRESLQRARKEFGLKTSQCYQDYNQFVKANLDIIMLGTPIPFHAEQSIKALENGKHVLCEVTAANTVEDCERLVRSVRKTGMKYMMAENYSYFYFIQQWKKLIKEEKLGGVFYAESEYVHEIRGLLKDPNTN